MTENTHPYPYPYRKGDTVFYHLRARDRPADPSKQWAGKITRIFESSATFPFPSVEVESLEPGYEGLREEVLFFQIVRVKRCKDEKEEI